MIQSKKIWNIIGFAYSDRQPKNEETKYYLWDQELWEVCDYVRQLENELYWLKTNPEYVKDLKMME